MVECDIFVVGLVFGMVFFECLLMLYGVYGDDMYCGYLIDFVVLCFIVFCFMVDGVFDLLFVVFELCL